MDRVTAEVLSNRDMPVPCKRNHVEKQKGLFWPLGHGLCCSSKCCLIFCAMVGPVKRKDEPCFTLYHNVKAASRPLPCCSCLPNSSSAFMETFTLASRFIYVHHSKCPFQAPKLQAASSSMSSGMSAGHRILALPSQILQLHLKLSRPKRQSGRGKHGKPSDSHLF